MGKDNNDIKNQTPPFLKNSNIHFNTSLAQEKL